jgi:hypothetical protein
MMFPIVREMWKHSKRVNKLKLLAAAPTSYPSVVHAVCDGMPHGWTRFVAP